MSQEQVIVNKEDLIQLQRDPQLPYLKCIELVKLTPQHFGLNKWQSRFKIPDHWMKKIYRSDIYCDTELGLANRRVVLTKPQRKILDNYLKTREILCPSVQSISKSTRKRPPVDCLLNDLESDDETDISEGEQDSTLSLLLSPNERTSQGTALGESTSGNIAICHEHKVQPEEFIVRIALDKMNRLSPDQEKEYQDLLKDHEFMQLLEHHVKKFVENME